MKIAPELFVGEHTKHTKESDIFAFGVVCWEISARREPWTHLKGNQLNLQNVIMQGTLFKKSNYYLFFFFLSLNRQT
jgi:hypothetical protein